MPTDPRGGSPGTRSRTGDALITELERCMFETFGVAQPVLTTLAVIDGSADPLTPSEIATRLVVPAASMTSTLDTLEARGWVVRMPNPADRRSVLVEITDEGRAVTDQLLPGVRSVELDLISVLTPAERKSMMAMLAKILARTAEQAEGPPRILEGRRNRPERLG